MCPAAPSLSRPLPMKCPTRHLTTTPPPTPPRGRTWAPVVADVGACCYVPACGRFGWSCITKRGRGLAPVLRTGGSRAGRPLALGPTVRTPCQELAVRLPRPEDVRDAALLFDADAERLQLADDAEIAPLGVLSSQTADQLRGMFGKGRTTWSAVRVCPAPLDQRAVPAQDRLWADEERSPALLRHGAARRATRARSDQVKRGRATCRRSTASWWRSTRISASVAAASIRWTRTTSMTRRVRR